ncbi:MAG: carbohydrate kinase family protein [Candidatus Anstonellales archaeon]
MDIVAIGPPMLDISAGDGKIRKDLGIELEECIFVDGKRFEEILAKVKNRILCRYPGGNEKNFAEGFAKLGGKVELYGTIGKDWEGKTIEEHLKKCRVKAKLREVKGRTGKVLSLLEKGKQSYVSFKGVSGEKTGAKFRNKLMYFSTYAIAEYGSISEEILELTKKNKYFFGLENAGIIKKYKHLHIAIAKNKNCIAVSGNESEIPALFGSFEKAKNWARKNGKQLFIKLGERGSMGIINGKFYKEKALRVRVKDSTGAGDYFNSGVAYAMLNETEEKKWLKIGNMLGAESCKYYCAKIGKVLKYEQ